MSFHLKMTECTINVIVKQLHKSSYIYYIYNNTLLKTYDKFVCGTHQNL